MGLGQLYISLETSVLCEDWIYRGNIRFFGRIISLKDCKTDGIVVEALIEEGADKVDDMLGQLHSGCFPDAKVK